MSSRRAIVAATLVVLLVVLLGCLLACGDAEASGGTGTRTAARSSRSRSSKSSTPRSPSGPPLVSGSSAYATPEQASAGEKEEPGEGGEEEREAGNGASEPLVENGLSSPLCTQAGADLSATATSHCNTSGFIASAAPTQDYGFDVNIDSGPEGSVAAYFQDYLLKPPWAMLVWTVHALLVGIEWSYTLDLLNSSAMKEVAAALRTLQRTFTRPLLMLALAFAAVALAWRGIVKRDCAASLGEALAILAMIAAGLFMVLDPLGTVGRLARWSDSASVETLGAVLSGSPAGPDRTLSEGMTELFETTIVAPWCFMEFGNVAWCDEPHQLDPALSAAAGKLASRDEAEAAKSGAQRKSGLTDIAQLLREARTNGAIFLAPPANGPARNSSKDQWSLLYAICKGPSATQCTGATAGEAEFRTSGFTIDRFVGLVMIGAGALGMGLLLGFVLTRLLGAAVLSLLFLLIAPGAVLMPALGERGRAAFRDWVGRLLGAVLAKLLWSFLLGTLLASMKILLLLGGFGWWVQWLLMSVLWWGAFHHRNRLLSLGGSAEAGSAHGSNRGRLPLWRSRSTLERSRRHRREWEERRDRNRALDRAGKVEPFEPQRLPGPVLLGSSSGRTPPPEPPPPRPTGGEGA